MICVDHSEAMLNQARASLEGASGHVEFRQGELDDLPLQDEEVNAVYAHMVLHHVPDLIASLKEMYRALQPGGRLVVSDLAPHRESWMTEEMADLRLGLDPTDLAQAHYRLALAQHRGGDANAARRSVLDALEIAPNYEEALDLLLEIRGG